MAKKLALASFLLLIASSLAAAWIWFPWVFSANYTIHVATGPLGSDGQNFAAAFKRELSEQRPRVRLVLAETAGLSESAEALQQGKVDVAVVRSDHPAAATGGTLIILRRLPLLFMVSAHAKVTSVSELAGKKIGVLEGTAEDDPLLVAVLNTYGLKEKKLVRIPLAEVGSAVHEKQVAAVVAIGPAGPGVIGNAVKAIVKATRKPPKFLDLDEAKAVTTRHPVYQEAEIPTGTFLGTPAIPDNDVNTLALTVRLVARNSMPDYVAGEFTRLLLVTKARLAATMPVSEITGPDTDRKEGVLPVHPGAAAYLDGNQSSLFEQAMDQLFNVSIIGGLLGSLGVWLSGMWRKHRPNETQQNLARLPAMLREVKTLPADRLDALEEELDELSLWFLHRFIRDDLTPDRSNSVSATIAQIRQAIERRRPRS